MSNEPATATETDIPEAAAEPAAPDSVAADIAPAAEPDEAAEAPKATGKAKRWYIVHAYSGFEKKVAQSIMEQAAQKGLTDAFEQVVVPTEDVVEVRRGKKISTERKFFPGYVLAKMDMTDATWQLVKTTPKVTGFLGGKGIRPAADHRRRGRRDLRAGRGGRRLAAPFGAFREWRAGQDHRRPVRVVRRHGGRRRRGPPEAQGLGIDLRPRHPGRAQFRPGAQGLGPNGASPAS